MIGMIVQALERRRVPGARADPADVALDVTRRVTIAMDGALMITGASTQILLTVRLSASLDQSSSETSYLKLKNL